MQRVSSYNLSDAEAIAMLAAADGVRSQSWLSSQHQEEAREESPANPSTTVAMRTRSKLAQSAQRQIAGSRPPFIHQHNGEIDKESDYDDCDTSK